jgi:hypothetical protein
MSGKGKVRIEIEVDSSTGRAQIKGIGKEFESTGQRGTRTLRKVL